MVKHREIIIVYAHDDENLYACYFDRDEKQFIHALTINYTYLSIPKISYRQPFYVKNCKTEPMGYALVRVYYNDFSDLNTIIAIDVKKTISIYNIPYKSNLFQKYNICS